MNEQEKTIYEDIYSSAEMERQHADQTAIEDGPRHAKSKPAKNRPAKKGKAKPKKRVMIALIAAAAALAVLIGGGVLFLLKEFDYNYNSMDVTNSDLGFEEVISKKVINIALFGVDTRNPTAMKGNTDSIMILSLNTQTKRSIHISILIKCLYI